jgi:hypothetical protein
MVTFTREDRRGRVLEFHSQGMGTREIAKLLHMSFTDIGKILKDSDKEKESEQQRTRQEFLSSQAYTLFSEGKSPVQVAIELNIRASEAIIFQREYWELEGLHNLNQIYQEIRDGTWNFVNLWKSVKAAGMGVPHVNRLLTIANNDLPSVESRYEGLKKEAATLEFQKASSARESQLLNNQIIMMRKTLDSTRLDYEKEMERLRHLQQEIMKQEALVKHFENSNEVYYIKIRKTVEEKVISILSNSKMLLKLALLSLTESMRKDPDRYISLIYHNNTYSDTEYNSQNSKTASYGQQQHHPSQDYISMLIEESEKLFNSLIKEWEDKIITDYTFSITSSSLPLLSPSDEKEQQSHPRQTTAANQSYMHTEEHRFTQSEIDDDN